MSGHVVPFPQPCMWCGQPATADATCPATIHCPHCEAAPGERCRHPNGHACAMHKSRRRAARLARSLRYDLDREAWVDA